MRLSPGNPLNGTIFLAVGNIARSQRAVTIMGGLILSQALTLYTTPIIYLGMARLSARWRNWRRPTPAPLARWCAAPPAHG